MIAVILLAATVATTAPAQAPPCDIEVMRNERAAILQPSIERAARSASDIMLQGAGAYQTVEQFAAVYFSEVLTHQQGEAWKAWIARWEHCADRLR